MPTTDALDSKLSTARPRYDEYEESGADWLGEIPAHWKPTRLRFLVELSPSKNEVRDLPKDEKVSFVPMEAIRENGGLALEQTRELGPVIDGYTYFQEGDVLVAKITPCFENRKGAFASNLQNGIGFGTTELHVLRPNEGMDGRYLFYVTMSHPFRKRGESTMYGAGGQKRVSDDFIRNLEWPIPPLDEQHAIAAYLDRETDRIDALIEKKEQLIDLLEEKRNSLISRVVTKGLDDNVEMKDSEVEWLGEIPAHWEIGKTGHILENLDSERIPVSASNRSEMQGEYPYYGASGVIDHVDDYLFDEPLILVAEDGANLFSRSTPLAFIARGKYWVNNHAHVLRPRYEPLEYWAYVLRSIVYDPWILGAAQPKLTQENLGSIELPMPPKEERMRIAERLNDEKKELNNLTERVEEAIDRLKEYRTALISAAVTGQIDVREKTSQSVGHQNS